MPLLWPSTRSARSAVAVVKSPVWPASTTARPRAIARCVLPTPGGTVSVLRHRSLSLAPARRPDADRQAPVAAGRRRRRLRMPLAGWHVDIASRMDDVPRAMRPARVGARAPGRGRRAGRTCRALSRVVGADIGRENRRDNSSHQGGSVRWHDDRAHTRHPSSPWSRPSPCGGKPFPARYATSYAVDSASFCCASPTPSGAQKRFAMSSEKIRSEHLQRAAFVYVRQSTLDQVRHHHESRRRQYDLAGHARSLGWVHVIVIDEDLGKSGATAAGRTGFQRLVAEVSLGHVGAVFGLEVSRLARNNRDWYQLLDLSAKQRRRIEMGIQIAHFPAISSRSSWSRKSMYVGCTRAASPSVASRRSASVPRRSRLR